MRFSKVLFVTLVASVLFSSTAFAAEEVAGTDWTSFAKALGFGLAGLGACLGQGKAASAALEAIGRNPGAAGEIQTPLLLGLAFMEAIALFGFGLSFVI